MMDDDELKHTFDAFWRALLAISGPVDPGDDPRGLSAVEEAIAGPYKLDRLSLVEAVQDIGPALQQVAAAIHEHAVLTAKKGRLHNE